MSRPVQHSTRAPLEDVGRNQSELHSRASEHHGPRRMPRTFTVSSLGSFVQEADATDEARPRLHDTVVTVLAVVFWMGSNLAVLLLNKLLLSYWSFRQPVLLTFLHMASGGMLTWGLWGVNVLKIQPIQSTTQHIKIAALSLVFALAVLSANVSLKFLAVSMNQAIGAATPVFAAMFAFVFQNQREHPATYATLALVVGGVIIASNAEPNLHLFGAAVCFAGAAFRGLRAVLQAMLLKPQEKLDSISCLAYMAPVSTLLMFSLCGVLEPDSYGALMRLPAAGTPMIAVISANCLAAFASNFFNMVVTKRTSALSIQVLGQCKGIISAVVSVLCFHNLVPAFGWIGYAITVIGCIIYGRCKAHFRLGSIPHEPPNLETAGGGGGVVKWLQGVTASRARAPQGSPSTPTSPSPPRPPHRPPLPLPRSAAPSTTRRPDDASLGTGPPARHTSPGDAAQPPVLDAVAASRQPWQYLNDKALASRHAPWEDSVLKGGGLGCSPADSVSSPRARRAALKGSSASPSVRSAIPTSSPLNRSEFSGSTGTASPDALASNPSATLQTVLSVSQGPLADLSGLHPGQGVEATAS